ncbi:hypothetical protein M5689_020986 [Euphorbia peplus]|nr:hypothetical protein M5689_020986 [Euphorbia peplus]
MSLVDYASSSDDDDHLPGPSSSSSNPNPTPTYAPRANQHPDNASNSSAPSSLKLPDASLLLNSPNVSSLTGNDHASTASRKRVSNELPSLLPRNKLPKGSLRNRKNVPDTSGGLLVPPQLTGRSNIVTEDIGKLFVRKKSESLAE